MPLLDTSHFKILFAGLEQQHIGFVPMDGNIGDQMIHTATRDLFTAFNISYRDISPAELDSGAVIAPVDTIVISGGGNMGSFWPVPLQQRRQALKMGLPVIIFPQSFTRNDEATECYTRVFVREKTSQSYHRDFILAPDTALALAKPERVPDTRFETGLFLRKDLESASPQHALSLGDPIRMVSGIKDYLALAARFEHIITDRLHFAIAGLISGRQVTLLPNSYHKNRAMYETWLCDLGCQWLETASEVAYDKPDVEQQLPVCLGHRQ